jgi:subtilisin family serine protease
MLNRHPGLARLLGGALAAVALPLIPAPVDTAVPMRAFALPSNGTVVVPWHLSLYGADLWKISTGAGVTVAVLDSGVDPAKIGDGLEGRVLPGIDYIDPTLDGRSDPDGHGSAVASILAASLAPAGSVGVAPEVTILPVRVLDDEGEGISTDIASGIRWAVDNGADIINLSLGGGYDPAVEEAVDFAVASDVIVVASSGNDASSEPYWPAALDNVVAVSAVDRDLSLASFANTGPHIDLTAPGVDIVHSWGGKTRYFGGTSSSAPQIAGLFALLRAAHPDVDDQDLIAALYATARDLGDPGRDTRFGFGLPDPIAAHIRLGGTPGDNGTPDLAAEPAILQISGPSTLTRSGVAEFTVVSAGGPLAAGTVVLLERLTAKGNFVEIDRQAAVDGVARFNRRVTRASTLRARSLNGAYATSDQHLISASVRGVRFVIGAPSVDPMEGDVWFDVSLNRSGLLVIIQVQDPRTGRWVEYDRHRSERNNPVASSDQPRRDRLARIYLPELRAYSAIFVLPTAPG